MREIQTAYQNSIKAHFGTRLRTMLNKLFGKEEKLNSLSESMKAERFTKKDIKEARHKEVFSLCTQVKLVVASKKIPPANILDEKSKSCIRNFLSAYPDSYKFQKAFYKLAQFFESEKLKKFNCFPLRTTFIPAYITLDSTIQKTSFSNS
ncbi:hypothetical protein EDC94DRAFT_623015 [Helicostylum pulchrum]|nr:hypothetical protein EDC94DRAFT_623015 [Helicostylum pulchrum]